MKSLLTIDEFTYNSGPVKEVFEKFISDLELFLDSKAVNISLEDTWMKDNPARLNNSIIEYIGSVRVLLSFLFA